MTYRFDDGIAKTEDGSIVTNAAGEPYRLRPAPAREEGIEAQIQWMRDRADVVERIRDSANRGFAEAFSRAVKKSS